MNQSSELVRLQMGVVLLMLATTNNPKAAQKAARIRADREGVKISEDDLQRAVAFVRQQAFSIFTGIPLPDTPSNGILAKFGVNAPQGRSECNS